MAVLLSLGCVGCAGMGASGIGGSVTVFHELPADTRGSTFAFASEVLGRPVALERKSYEALLRRELEAHGWQHIAAGSGAGSTDYIVNLVYDVGTSKTVTGSVPVFGQTGGGTSFSSGSISGPSGNYSYSGSSYSAPSTGQVGSIPYQRTTRARGIGVTISNAQTPDIRQVYDGVMISTGRSGELAEVVPAMIQTLMRDFPGESGKVKRYASMDGR